MTDTELPAHFRARLARALSRPSLLDPGAVEGVAAGAFRAARADASTEEPFARAGDVAIVSVEGPLSQRAWSCWGMAGDGYDAITARAAKAHADPAVRAVVLRLDSPGGEVAGCQDCARALRAQANASGKPLVAYADELAASAAYWLASQADELVVPETGLVGSVGVITTVIDRTAANAAAGRVVRVVRSGRLKAVPHPDEPATDEALAPLQTEVDALARIFAEGVAPRRGMTPEQVLAFDAALFLGARAVAAGLADRTGNLTTAVERARALAANTPKRKRMDAIIKALGLSPDADEAAACAAVVTLQTRADEASAAVAKLSTELSAANDRAAAAEARAAAVERAAELEAAKAARQWTPALDGFLGTLSVEQLRAWRSTAPAVVPEGEVKAPPLAESGADRAMPPTVAELVARATQKGWASLAPGERHAIAAHDKTLAARLRKQG